MFVSHVQKLPFPGSLCRLQCLYVSSLIFFTSKHMNDILFIVLPGTRLPDDLIATQNMVLCVKFHIM